MQENHLLDLTAHGLTPMSHAEMAKTNGGGLGGFLLDAGLFLVSPALGVFNLGVKQGYREASRGV